jgi:predicted O-methyltransferase YrrM
MIEIGCQQGRTAKTILDHVPSLQRYIGIDIPFGKRTTLLCQRSEIPYTAGLWVADNVRFALALCDHGSLELTADNLEPCDAVFIDGDHSAKAVLHDSYLAHLLVRSGGIIVWHDYGNPAVEVTQVLDQLCVQENWPIYHVENTWLAYRRIDHAVTET